MAPPVSRAPVMQDFLAQGIIHHHRAVKVLIGEHDRVVDVPVLHMRKVAVGPALDFQHMLTFVERSCEECFPVQRNLARLRAQDDTRNRQVQEVCIIGICSDTRDYIELFDVCKRRRLQ
ncbi:hypothetical protein HBH56_152740 [Parastagonospora nodorum]|uniref:Uncharacterized protein n=1 Tax=Phaeosphaeria nodorum (strain SN15 / ATCC MYA-4574 / FGSC 10173) TaxID=321614 RepID=A0A7U2EZX2_PHANO|nr:hypothetical protein HBH56_152740 [Parastagonospora nodorum]QRC96062.1 hypothetical protein JI435_057030 [Parastagonospora nodorum SN15]KAH3926582.1 hypothetical protein HBH54_164940 [Parastagonospora nodorum]KAH3940379.1 hypothetical protein HBH53_217880 [Parastagonospora nodorum]KAH4063688.1 hypothetical protein HBH50_185290 [Parastagonospora nodorum]